MKNKHLSFDDRLEIEKGLNENKSFKAIGTIINKDVLQYQKRMNYLQASPKNCLLDNFILFENEVSIIIKLTFSF